MSVTYIPAELRRIVTQRAEQCCEYCLLHQSDSFFSLEVDHIIPEKHGGLTEEDNLALSCPDCNGYKGSDIASFDPQTSALTLLFHPRKHDWSEHFQLSSAYIAPITDIGRVTIKILKINTPERVEDREVYRQLGSYPGKSLE